MQFRKIAAVAGSALLAGATLATAGIGATVNSVGEITTKLGTPEEPFPIFVVGENAAASDVAAAIDIAVRLAANHKTTEPVEVTTAKTTVTGGALLETETTKIYLNGYINDAVEALDVQNLQDLLKSGKIKIGSKTYTYNQYLRIGQKSVRFGKPGDEEDPVFISTTEKSSPKETCLISPEGKSVTSVGVFLLFMSPSPS